jgi:hypothetical protein
MTRLVFVCSNDDGTEGHETQILMNRCVHCGGWAIAGYRCTCGMRDEDPDTRLMGHGKGECTE